MSFNLLKYFWFLLLISFMGSTGYARAEAIKQCFKLNNFPNRSIQSFWIQKAEFKEKVIHNALAKRLTSPLFSSLREKHLPVMLQEITAGKGLVFAYRDDFHGWPDLTDTATLQYLTVYIPGKLSKNSEIDLAKENEVLVVLTEGSPSFRNFCFGYADKGKINFQVLNGSEDEITNKIYSRMFRELGEDAVVMNIDVTVSTKNTNEAWSESCGVCTLEGTLVFSKSIKTNGVRLD